MGGRTISRLNFSETRGRSGGGCFRRLPHRLLLGRDGRLTAGRGNGKTGQQEATRKHRQEPTGGNQQEAGSEASRGRLLARPGLPRSDVSVSAGLYLLGLGSKRDGLLYVPKGYRAGEEAPLALVLHGSRSDAQNGISPFLGPADRAGLILLAPDSRDWRDWDIFFPGHYGPDVRFIDRALEQTFDRFAVDAGRLAVMGFSDGASYALSLGLSNGDLFTHVAAFAPGLMMPAAYRGEPSVFVSHGMRDEVLEIDKTSRRLVPRLERKGYAAATSSSTAATQFLPRSPRWP